MGKRRWSQGYNAWVQNIVRQAREAGDWRPVNQIRFDPKYTSTTQSSLKMIRGVHYTGPELPLPVPSLPRGEDGHKEADGGKERSPGNKSTHNRDKREADNVNSSPITVKSEVVKHKNQSIKAIERNRSHQQLCSGSNTNLSSSPCSNNSLAKLNLKELRNLVDNPETAKLKARHELDKIMQEHRSTLPKINNTQDSKKIETACNDPEALRVIKKEAPEVSEESGPGYLDLGPGDHSGLSSAAQEQDGAESEPPVKKCKQSSGHSGNVTSASRHTNSQKGEIVPALKLLMDSELIQKVHSTSMSDILNNNSNDVSGQQVKDTSREETMSSVSNSKKKPPAKSLASVENIFARKIKELKEIKKKEFEVMKSIDSLDKQMSDLLRKRREKIKELKEIQKEERAVLNA